MAKVEYWIRRLGRRSLSLALFVTLGGCQQAAPLFQQVLPIAPPPQRPAPLPQDPQIQVYMNQNLAQGADYRDPYREIERPGDDLEAVILSQINGAKTSIDLAVQELRLPGIAQALVAKQQAGVKVRVVIENSYHRYWHESDSGSSSSSDFQREVLAFVDTDGDGQVSAAELAVRDAIAILRNGRVPLLDDTADGSRGSGLMHHKFMIIDGAVVVTGSANFTLSDVHGDVTEPESRGNANNLLVVSDRPLAQAFTEEFNLMWGDGPGGRPDSRFGLQKPRRLPQMLQIGNSRVTLNFSPTSPTRPWAESGNGVIALALQSTQQRADLALFVFSDQGLGNTLGNRHAQGVKLRVLIDPSFAFRYFSEGLDLLGVEIREQCRLDPDNRPWPNPIDTVGVPNLPPGDKLHHKFGVVDQRLVITGSHNWSAAANHTNDETVLVIENPVVAAHYDREFERLYGDARLGLTSKTKEKIAENIKTCGR
ncbi:phospholipase D-like domain-containing protein [Spirulina sp. CCNP1310]|uniref:phospholipase D-like domain-containing protein n=1 Tax=Spirulina sp. CCNP1310 TaxID=3110249 RepID=UPI002B1F2488|nr:phospholipase D-like domain-containing protein [Spirulina sp. CCNP1310]MEA5421004.1 phospholipase D-like domain-containing protein [Spirulina sp. CCNP1310]